MAWKWRDDDMFSMGVAPIVWTSLDLKHVDPAELAFVLIDSAGSTGVYFRPKDDAADWEPAGDNLSRGAHGAYAVINEKRLVAPRTIDGWVDWIAGNASDKQLQILGTIQGLEDGGAGALPVAAAVPVAWTKYDVSAVTGLRKTIVILEVLGVSGGAETLASRPPDDADGNWNDIGGSTTVSSHRTISPAVGERGQLFAFTNDLGEVELSSTGGVDTNTITVSTFLSVDGGMSFAAAGREEVYASAPPPTVTEALDLTQTSTGLETGLPAERVLAFLKIRAANFGTFHSYGTAPYGYNGDLVEVFGNAGNWFSKGVAGGRFLADGAMLLVCPTDSHGKIQWDASATAGLADATVDLITWVYPTTASMPTVVNAHPAGPTTALDEIGCTITDEYGLIRSSLTLIAQQVAGEPSTIIKDGVVQAGWTGRIMELDDIGLGPRRIVIEIELDGWEIFSPIKWAFSLSCSSISGKAL